MGYFFAGLMVLFAAIAIVAYTCGAIYQGYRLTVISVRYPDRFSKHWHWFRHVQERSFFDALDIAIERTWEDREAKP